MKELGILPELLKFGSVVEAVSLRRFEDGKVLTRRPGGERISAILVVRGCASAVLVKCKVNANSFPNLLVSSIVEIITVC